MFTCIYCRKNNASPFPKEHVIPRAFGRFRENLTLNCVCANCNSFFNRELEVFLARDSVEAILRVRHGLKTKSRSRAVGQTKIVVRVISQGDWYGSRVVLERDSIGRSLSASPLPQVAFRKLGESEWKWVLERDLEGFPDIKKYRIGAEAKIVGSPQSAVERLVKKLAAIGINFKKKGDFERSSGQVKVFAKSILDDIIFRGIGKIAFNFLTYVRGQEFALRQDFDLIREYVRFGRKLEFPPVIASQFPILAGDDARYRQTYGHVLVLDWDRKKIGIVCLLSLFNQITYHVILCPTYSGIWHPISEGRHFDLRTSSISAVQGIGSASDFI